jgi:hypothetical protein
MVRTISHFHSPFSWDACDQKGLQGTRPNPVCLKHLRNALCSNKINLIFITDHPNSMEKYEIRDLLLQQDGDEILLKNGAPYSNKMGGCPGGFYPKIVAGFEDRLLALGMTRHLDSDVAVRSGLYQQESFELRSRLASEAEALVFIPHTESRSLETIREIQPDGIEIYNFHANTDPKIRSTSLNAPPFEKIPGILSYLVDPYDQLHPDFSFMNFIQFFDVYQQKWDALVSGGMKVAGFAGTDSHENVFPQIASDGERLDSHRRMIRMVSNHLLVHSDDVDEIKQAMKQGRGWVVFEGFGSPVGMDFYATQGDTTLSVGQTGSLAGASATLGVTLPSLHRGAPQRREKALIRIRLKQILSNGDEQIVASTEGQSLSYTTQSSGIYRAEISIIPRHLRELLGAFSAQADREFLWIMTNPIYLEP